MSHIEYAPPYRFYEGQILWATIEVCPGEPSIRLIVEVVKWLVSTNRVQVVFLNSDDTLINLPAPSLFERVTAPDERLGPEWKRDSLRGE